jgi:hypothetical protein
MPNEILCEISNRFRAKLFSALANYLGRLQIDAEFALALWTERQILDVRKIFVKESVLHKNFLELLIFIADSFCIAMNFSYNLAFRVKDFFIKSDFFIFATQNLVR